MTAVYLTMTLILLLALAVAAVVVIGMRGAYKDKAPTMANHFAEAARHLNGDAEPPQALVNLMESAPARR